MNLKKKNRMEKGDKVNVKNMFNLSETVVRLL